MSKLPQIIDMHVHLVGNGRQGSGCWLRLGGTWWQKPLAAYMLNHIGLGGTAVQGVDFDGRIVRYVGREIDALRLAYATSIHKSQGSEYPAVVIPLQTSHFPMLSRNLLYTAVTRAKRLCVLVADPRALRIALGELRRERRCTGLAERLRAGGGPVLLNHDRG